MSRSDETKGINRNLTRYGDTGFSRFMRRAFMASAGYDRTDLSRPVIGIADTSSDYNLCHRGMPDMVAAVKRGVLEAGGLPLAFPTMSLNEILTSPTTMFYRNLAAMVTEEMIRSQPMDAVVLMGGCDKTVPAQVMAAVSVDLPAVCAVTGPMLTGRWRGERLGACTDCRRFWGRHRAGELSSEEIDEVEQNLVFTGGTCMVMGTATTMACLVETLGLMPPGAATPPAASGERLKACAATGRLAVELAETGRKPSDILSRASFLNAITVLAALSGSTNAIIHLTAIARRAGIDIGLDDFHRAAQNTPVIADIKPAGNGYAEDLHHAGGVPSLLKALESLLDPAAPTITGRPLGDLLRETDPPGDWQETIRPITRPLKPAGALSVLYGTLAPDGAVIKAAAADPDLMEHQGPAVVFESPEDAAERIDDPALNVTPESVLVLRNAGPVAAGMPEAGSLPIPKYLAARGVTDIVRVSDARMSGTAYGTVVLHCSPEAAAGGPLALVRNGDLIRLSVAKQRIDLVVDDTELARRRKNIKPYHGPERGWAGLHARHVTQAQDGVDLDFM